MVNPFLCISRSIFFQTHFPQINLPTKFNLLRLALINLHSRLILNSKSIRSQISFKNSSHKSHKKFHYHQHQIFSKSRDNIIIRRKERKKVENDFYGSKIYNCSNINKQFSKKPEKKIFFFDSTYFAHFLNCCCLILSLFHIDFFHIIY